MSSKAFLLLALIAAVALLISSEVTARDLAENTAEVNITGAVAKQTAGVDDAKHDGYGGYGGNGGYGGQGGHGGYGGHGGHGGHGGYGGGGGRGGGYGGRCRYRCCKFDYYGGCSRCCSYAGEVVDADTQTDPHN